MISVPESIYISNRIGNDPLPGPIDPVYTLNLLDVTQTTAEIECISNVDCTMQYGNQQDNIVENTFTDSIILVANVPQVINLNNLNAGISYLFRSLFVPSDNELESGSRSLTYTLAPQLIGLTISLERAPFPDNETTIRLFITVDVACSCDVTVLGLGSVPSPFTETFDGPTVRRQLEFNGLLPNNAYEATVVASAPDAVGNEQTASIVTAAPFPNLSKFEMQSVDATYAYVTVDLDGPGSASFHLESIDDADYVREDVYINRNEEYAHLFDGLVGSKSYKCVCDSVFDVYGNEKPNGTEFQFTTDPPITVNATLAPPALPQGRTELISEVNASKACSVELILSGNGEVYTQIYTQTGPGIVPRTFDVLTPDTEYILNATVSASQGDEATTAVSATTLPPQLQIVASLSTPSVNAGTSLVANFDVNRVASVLLTLTAEGGEGGEGGETYEQEMQEGTQSFVFQGLTPSTLYTLTALATADSDGSEASASDTKSTLASSPPILISVDLTSTVNTERPPVDGSAPTDDDHIVPLAGQYGPWNAILIRNGQQTYEKLDLLDGNQEETSIGVVINSNGAQHYTYGHYEGGGKTNVGEDVIGIATPQNTGTIIECYFTGLNDSKTYTMRMFGQHLNRSGWGSINFAKFGVNGDKKDTDLNTATCSWYAVAPSGGIINFSVEYVNPLNNNEYASLGGFQLQEEAN